MTEVEKQPRQREENTVKEKEEEGEFEIEECVICFRDLQKPQPEDTSLSPTMQGLFVPECCKFHKMHLSCAKSLMKADLVQERNSLWCPGCRTKYTDRDLNVLKPLPRTLFFQHTVQPMDDRSDFRILLSEYYPTSLVPGSSGTGPRESKDVLTMTYFGDQCETLRNMLLNQPAPPPPVTVAVTSPRLRSTGSDTTTGHGGDSRNPPVAPSTPPSTFSPHHHREQRSTRPIPSALPQLPWSPPPQSAMLPLVRAINVNFKAYQAIRELEECVRQLLCDHHYRQTTSTVTTSTSSSSSSTSDSSSLHRQRRDSRNHHHRKQPPQGQRGKPRWRQPRTPPRFAKRSVAVNVAGEEEHSPIVILNRIQAKVTATRDSLEELYTDILELIEMKK